MEKINISESRVQQADRLCGGKKKSRLSAIKSAKKGLKRGLNQSSLTTKSRN